MVEVLSDFRNRNECTRTVQEKLFLGLCFVFGQFYSCYLVKGIPVPLRKLQTHDMESFQISICSTYLLVASTKTT